MTRDCRNCTHYEPGARWCSYQGEQVCQTAGGCRSFSCHCEGGDPECDCEQEAIRDFVGDEAATRDMEAGL